jgi:excisionase family DNA binding protein
MSKTETWMTVQQAADALGVSSKTIRRRIQEGGITAYRLGPRLIRIKAADLEQPASLAQIEGGLNV